MLGQLVLISMAIRDCVADRSAIRNLSCWISEIISDSSAGIDGVMLMMIGFDVLVNGGGRLSKCSAQSIYCDNLCGEYPYEFTEDKLSLRKRT